MEENVSGTCQIVLCPCRSKQEARRIGVALVEQGLAAAVNIVGADSIYRWQGRIEQTTEFVLLIKSEDGHYKTIEQTILKMHSYKLPGIAVLPVVDGSAPYLEWMRSGGAV